MGAFYLISAHNQSSTWGVIKEVFAMRSAAGDTPDGPLSKELREAGLRLAQGKTNIERVDSKDKAKLRSVGTAEIEALRPVLADVSPEGRSQVIEWLTAVAERTASAAKDKGGVQQVTEAEQGAIAEITRALQNSRDG